MSKTLPFTGSGVAIITPFDGLKTNYDELGKLIEYHIENNTDAIKTNWIQLSGINGRYFEVFSFD